MKNILTWFVAFSLAAGIATMVSFGHECVWGEDRGFGFPVSDNNGDNIGWAKIGKSRTSTFDINLLFDKDCKLSRWSGF